MKKENPRKSRLTLKILKDTKSLVLNCSGYNQYIENTFKVHSNKLPEIKLRGNNLSSFYHTSNYLITNQLEDEHHNTRNSNQDYCKNSDKTINSRNKERLMLSFISINNIFQSSNNSCNNQHKNYLNINENKTYFISLINKLRNNKIDLSEVSISKTITENHNCEYEIKLNSVKVSFFKSFKDINKTDLVFEIYLPLTILPLIYLLSPTSLKKFMCFSLKFTNDINQTFFNLNSFQFLINNLDEFHNFSKENSHFTLTNHRKVSKFLWITTNEVYDVIFTMPTVEMLFVKSNVKIIKYIEKETVINSLINRSTWNTNVFNDLNRYKTFRHIINLNFSKHSKAYLDQTIIIDNPKDLISNDLINPKSVNFEFVYTNEDFQSIFINFNSSILFIQGGETVNQINLTLNQIRIIEQLKKTYNGQINCFVRKLINVQNNSIL